VSGKINISHVRVVLCVSRSCIHLVCVALHLLLFLFLFYFFFSSRRRHTRSVSAFLLNRSSDLWFALSLLRFRLPSRLPMMFILWMVAMMVVIIPSRTV